MRIVVALDSFKGSLSAPQACDAVRQGVLSVAPDAEVVLCPMADGGEGTAEALMVVAGGEWVSRTVCGPLGQPVTAGYAWLGESSTAVVEMAAASGLPLLGAAELDPLRTTTFGTGELLGAAAGHEAARILLGVGGSATIDGGVGAATALGWRFLTKNGAEVGPGGGELRRIASIVSPRESALPPVEVLCDVDNCLVGERGAARVFGRQKGASFEGVKRLEEGLAHLADLVSRELGLEVATIPGGGAAGGLAAGAVAFFEATLSVGVDAVMTALRLSDRLVGADWVVTGEGRFDHQSLHGKVVSGVVRRAAEAGVKVAVIAGSVAVAREEWSGLGIDTVEAARPTDMSLEVALERSETLLLAAAQRFARSCAT